MFPIKIFFLIAGVSCFALSIQILKLFAPHVKNKMKFRKIAYYATWPGIRMGLLGAGIVWINRKGDVFPKTRTIIVNHESISDILLLMSQYPLCILAMKSLESSAFIQAITHVFKMIFVDRSRRDCKISQQIIKIQENKTEYPLMIFPEGKITNGNGLVGFRSGAFIYDAPVQAFCIRYKFWFCSKNMGTIAWLEPDMKTFFYQLLAIPFITVDINVLDPVDFGNKKLTPKQKAEVAELQMANFLGCPAYRKTNKCVFKGKICVN